MGEAAPACQDPPGLRDGVVIFLTLVVVVVVVVVAKCEYCCALPGLVLLALSRFLAIVAERGCNIMMLNPPVVETYSLPLSTGSAMTYPHKHSK